MTNDQKQVKTGNFAEVVELLLIQKSNENIRAYYPEDSKCKTDSI